VFLGVLYDISLSVSVATSLVTNFQTSGVTTAMVLEIPVAQDPALPGDPPPFVSCGIYEIDQVVGKTITSSKEFPLDETPVWASILQDDPDFAVNAASVSSVALFDFEANGVRPGDVLVLTSGEFTILTVSTTTLTLTQDTGLLSNETGKIVRRVKPWND